MFPKRFFDGAEGLRSLRWIVEDVMCAELGLAVEDLPQRLTRELLAEWRLGGVLYSYFQNSPRVLLQSLYPGRFHAWQFARVPCGYWSGDPGRKHAREAIQWLVQCPLGGKPGRMRSGAAAVLRRHGLAKLLKEAYHGSVTVAIADALPDQPPWIIRCPNAYWTGPGGRERAIAAVRWLVERRLGLPSAELTRTLTFRLFKKYGLGPMLGACFGGSPFRAVDAAYPGRYRPWEFRCVPMGYWTGAKGREHAREAVCWLAEQVAVEGRPLGRADFHRHRLETMVKIVYHGSLSAALRDAGLFGAE